MCQGVSKCPVFPTEVVFALDMSNDVSELDFERMRDILLSLLMKMEISESNCPKGARVAIVSYNNKIDYLLRFSDYKGKPALLQATRKIPRERSSGSRNLGAAMRFVARHGFKRVRSGLLMRKVAVFFQAGWAHDAESVSTATLELSALDIIPAIITFTEEHNLPDALVVREGTLWRAGELGRLVHGPTPPSRTTGGMRAVQGKNFPEIDVYAWRVYSLWTVLLVLAGHS